MRQRSVLVGAFVVLAAAAPLVSVACSAAGGAATAGSPTSGGGAAGGAGGHGGAADAGLDAKDGGGGDPTFQDQGACTTGQPCGDGGICTGMLCCEATLACGDICCSAGDVCSFQKCVTPGAPCHDPSDCSPSEYCDDSLGDNADAGVPDAACVSGTPLLSGKCLPKPPECPADAGPPDGAPDCIETCNYQPVPGAFNPVLKYAWGGNLQSPFDTDVMMTPIVIQLDDDDCDGKVTERDIPEIVFSSYQNKSYGTNGTLHAISIVNGAVVEKWKRTGINPGKQIAGGDIDGLPGNEVVVCAQGANPTVMAFRGDGASLWTSPAVMCFMPSIADIDGDGTVEVIVEGGILDGATGALKHAFSPALNTTFVVSDIDGDGQLDVVTGNRGYHADGTVFVDTGVMLTGSGAGSENWKTAWPAIADFDKDGIPEIAVLDNMLHTLSIWHYDANQPGKFVMLRAPIDLFGAFPANTCQGAGKTHGGGPPTVADFDGDGFPDVGTALGIGYVVLSGKKLLDPNVVPLDTILWAQTTTDCSSAETGSSVFDFDGDGKAEVVYGDELHLRIFDGTTGTVLSSVCNTSWTLLENPVIADVDNDGHADIVVVSNAAQTVGTPSFQCMENGAATVQAGVRVFGDMSNTWVRTRAVWNQHAYHVTNVDDDGTIPQHELANWLQPGLNDFRQNKQPGSEFAAADAVVTLAPLCTVPIYTLVATVRNMGQAPMPAWIPVDFYLGTPPNGTPLGGATTTKVLYPAEAQNVSLALANPDPAITSGTMPVYAVVVGPAPHPSWQECRSDNNTSAPVNGACSVLH